ncbi:sensor histidine kinase [Carboxylicivirga sp. A043]|uniref:sensor histidine kinase n=1 Tax=Carboxylicivirga litoralis TaxID=2816963 RepID=UPI0021CB4CB0|nr:HAMP domain-containing histidine kinase [Carboxylicivirga sp. A043]MCU4155046.1 sensor histidine kinase [Carboxylicivirga sp. A043]
MSNRFIIKPWLIVGLLLVIPTSLFTAIELLTLNDQEEVIESIYTKQLESVLFSINQYTDDIANNWIDNVYKNINLKDHASTSEIKLNDNQNVKSFVLHPIDSTSLKLDKFIIANDTLKREIINQLLAHTKEIDQLKRYIKSGYRKVIGIDLEYQKHLTMLVFITENDKTTYLNILLLDAQHFISNALSPRIQMAAGDDLVIVVRHSKTNELMASSLLNEAPDEVVKEQAIWLLPDYSLGILPVGISISELANKRATQNIGLLILVDILLIVGAWLFYRNVKRELHLAKVKSDFVSNVSHEIRTPLALISMYAETLQLGRVKDETKRNKYYDIIYRETQRLSSIVNNILNFSRIESGRQKLTFATIELNDIVDEVVNNYQYHFKERGFAINIDTNNGLEPIYGDQQAITESLINLVDNAMKYSADVKEIRLSTGTKGQYQYIEVADKGLGISAKEQKHIFEKFYRVTKGALAHHAKGSGLGLSIVMHIIKGHNGKIELESTEGNGSCFRILLPINKLNKQ